VALAQTRAVAANAMATLGLTKTETVTKFLGTYSVTAPTDRIMQITAGAPSSADAIKRASALAHVFLKYLDSELQTQQTMVVGALNQQIAVYQHQVNGTSAEVAKYRAEPKSGAQKAELAHWQGLYNTNYKALQLLVKSAQGYGITITTMIESSYVLDKAAALPQSHVRLPAEYAAAGLFAGLAAGLGFVAIGALASDRLRRRDDVARALGVPVQLSIGRLRQRQIFRRRRRSLATAQNRDLHRIVAILRASLPQRRGPIAMAVVAVDDTEIPALAVLSLAVAKARSGSQVMIADLTADRAATKLLGVSSSGVRMSTIEGHQVIVAVPEAGDVTPAGPVRPTPPPPRTRPVGPALEAAYESADLMLTLATLDPSVGADHLATWAHSVIVMLTAGQSSATKVLATGELIRLSGAPLTSAILLGADKKDDSLGALPSQAARHRMADRQQAVAQPTGAVSR
jgi:capsular polysaccharide biosynthesis protein